MKITTYRHKKDARIAVLHPLGDKWRISFFRPNGPSSHCDVRSQASVDRELQYAWIEDESAGVELDEWTNTDEWRIGLLQLRYVAAWNLCSFSGRFSLGIALGKYAREHGLEAAVNEYWPKLRKELRSEAK